VTASLDMHGVILNNSGRTAISLEGHTFFFNRNM